MVMEKSYTAPSHHVKRSLLAGGRLLVILERIRERNRLNVTFAAKNLFRNAH